MRAGPCGALVLLWLCACATSDVTLRSDPRLPHLRAQGLRIAVLPFAVSAAEEGFLAASLGPVGELLSLEIAGAGVPARARIGALMRQQVIGWLGRSDFEVIEPWATDTTLVHRGLDPAALQDRARSREVAGLLQVDAVLYGDVTHWNRSYYLVESRARVGLRLELVDGAIGDTLFFTERVESLTSGLRGGPTGIVSAVTEPVAGLRTSHLRELTRAASRGAALDLAGDVGEAPAAADAPRLSFVAVALPHDGVLRPGERIDVVALGTPGCEVRFDLGTLRRAVPMTRRALYEDPRGARASYHGHYIVQPGEAARDLPVHATIRGTRQNHSSASRYRWADSVSFGAEAAVVTGAKS